MARWGLIAVGESDKSLEAEPALRVRHRHQKVIALAILICRSNIGGSPQIYSGTIFMGQPLDPIARLMRTLRIRAETLPAGSYTTQLLRGGPAKIGSKIREEAEELVEAASQGGDEGRQHVVHEAGDLVYHIMVLLAWRGVDIDEVATELARREGTSGLAEKASRQNKESTQGERP